MNETIETLLHRNSPRSFDGRHVEKEKLELILSTGLKAPSGMNRQPVRFIVVSNDKMVKKLSELNSQVLGINDGSDPFYGAKDVIVVLALKQASTRIYDGSLAIGNMLNAAYSLGVRSRWIHRAKEVFASEEGLKILHDLGVEEELEGIGFCIFGYNEQEDNPKEIIEGRTYYVE